MVQGAPRFQHGTAEGFKAEGNASETVVYIDTVIERAEMSMCPLKGLLNILALTGHSLMNLPSSICTRSRHNTSNHLQPYGVLRPRLHE